MLRYPFTAVVGADDLSLALVLTSISPSIGGVLVRGEKGTAKSTIVRGLVDVLPPVEVIEGCRYSCDPGSPDPECPDGPHHNPHPTQRPTRLVELPVGAGEDRVAGSMDLAKALGAGEATFHPGLLAAAHRGLLYVDEVNLLHDHLVDLLLDASAMGRNTVERDGMSVSHAARFVLIGTMNPEEGELRPQLLDRFGLSVDVVASRDPGVRTEVVRRRLSFDDNPDAFVATYTQAQDALRQRILTARTAVEDVALTPWALRAIARVCAGFDVDGMRADIVIARAAMAHAAWMTHTQVERDDVRAAARFALAHRRRRGPFDPPGLDEDLLDRLLDEEPEPPSPPDGSDDPDSPGPSDDGGHEDSNNDRHDDSPSHGSGAEPDAPSQAPNATNDVEQEHDSSTAESPADAPEGDASQAPSSAAAPAGTVAAGAPYRPHRFEVSGLGVGEAGRRSAAETSRGRIVGTAPERTSTVHVAATIREAARRRASVAGGRLVVAPTDVKYARLHGREANLVLFCVDASGSMAARKRMQEVKTAVLSLLLDAYERRDRVGLVTFAGEAAQVPLPPTSSVDRAATLLADIAHGGRTPLAEGLTEAVQTLRRERLRDPRRRPLVVLVTDGRATAGKDALSRAQHIADAWPHLGLETVVIDCESGRFRMHLARGLAHRMGATHVPLEDVSAQGILGALAVARPNDRKAA